MSGSTASVSGLRRLAALVTLAAVVPLLHLAAVPATVAHAEATSAKQRGGNDRVEWVEDLAEAKRRAAAEEKLLFVFLYRSGNRTDSQYRQGTLESRQIAEILSERFIAVRLERRSDAARDFLRRNPVRIWPAVWLLWPNGRPHLGLEGQTARGRLRRELESMIERADAQQGPRPAQQEAWPRPGSGEDGVAPAREFPTDDDAQAIKRALTWLAEAQRDDGSYSRSANPDERRRGDALDYVATAMTAAAGLTLRAHASHDEQVLAAVEWLIQHAHEDGLISQRPERALVLQAYTFWEVPLAMWLLAEMILAKPEHENVERWREVMQGAARLLVAHQHDEDGGWGYGLGFEQRDADGPAGWTILATTALCTGALGLTRRLGISVAGLNDAIRNGVHYILACQQRDGGCRYRRGAPMLSYPEASAFAVLALAMCGQSSTHAYARLAEYLRGHSDLFGRQLLRYHPGGRFALGLAHAMLDHHPPSHRRYQRANDDKTYSERWHSLFRNHGRASQHADEFYFADVEDKGGHVWATAGNLLALGAEEAATNLRILRESNDD